METENGYIEVLLQHSDAGNLGRTYLVPLSAIQKPIGWSERYTITCNPDKVSEVVGWMSRGIMVRQSQYIGDASTVFQPMDNADVPGWKYTKLTDTVPPDQCTDAIQIVKLETEYDIGIPVPCRYCVGGKRTPDNNPALARNDYNLRCTKCNAHLGFSFTEPYHFDQGDCSDPYGIAECWVCSGTGQGLKYLSEMSKADRHTAIQTMHRDGWKVRYVRRNGIGWMRERETVVKDFGQEVK